MKRSEYIKILNDFAYDGEVKNVIRVLNQLFDNGKYKEHLDLVFITISDAQLYGFLAYLDEDELKEFFKCDFFCSSTYRGNSLKFYNRGQLSLLNELENENKVFFSAPTSFGKTSIICEYFLNNYKKINNMLLILPTNSLLEELYCKFLRFNNELKMGYTITTQPYLYGSRNILLLTPERLLMILENNDINTFDLIVMDEAYKIVDSKNDSISDFVNCRAVRFRKVADKIAISNKKVFFLSPFTYELSKSMRNFLEKNSINKINRELEYVDRKIIDVSNAEEFKKVFNTNESGYNRSLSIPEKTAKIILKLKEQKNIVYVGCYNAAYKIADKVQGVQKEIEDPRFKDFIVHLNKTYSIDDTHKWQIITALEKRIGIYISPMPRYLKREIISLYERNEIETLIVTTSFTEGVNTNASNLIFTSTSSGPTKNKLSPIDILNVTGRAGRFAKNTIGRVYCIKEDIYKQVKDIQTNSKIVLENYNYQKSEYNRLDYEIEMIDDEYLSINEYLQKKELQEDINHLGLNKKDLNISLNVSTRWKITLYKAFQSLNQESIYNINTCLIDILESVPNKTIESLSRIFKYMRNVFMKNEIQLFPQEVYEINPFDSNDEFIWGRLYKIYLAGSIKQVVKKNIQYINYRFNIELEKNGFLASSKDQVEELFKQNNISWILRYYDKNLHLNYNVFYSETFKFISNIVQYKIPYYLTFFVSIFKLFLEKNKIEGIDKDKLNAKKIVSLFEDGNSEIDYRQMIDYGLSNDIIIKLKENGITFEKVVGSEYDTEHFDSFENRLLDDFKKYYA